MPIRGNVYKNLSLDELKDLFTFTLRNCEVFGIRISLIYLYEYAVAIYSKQLGLEDVNEMEFLKFIGDTNTRRKKSRFMLCRNILAHGEFDVTTIVDCLLEFIKKDLLLRFCVDIVGSAEGYDLLIQICKDYAEKVSGKDILSVNLLCRDIMYVDVFEVCIVILDLHAFAVQSTLSCNIIYPL